MMGRILRLFIDYTAERHSDELLDDALRAAAPRSLGAYTSHAIYDDDEFLSLVEAVARLSGQDDHEVQRQFGRHAFPSLANLLPNMKTQYVHVFDLLKNVECPIHTEQRKVYDVEPPIEAGLRQASTDSAIFFYRSKRPCAHLALGLLEGALAHYGHSAGTAAMVSSNSALSQAEFLVRLND